MNVLKLIFVILLTFWGVSAFALDAPNKCKIDKDCRLLAEAGYFESRGEPDRGVVAVMQTILNRQKSPFWSNSIERIIYSPKQFSYTTKRDKVMRDKEQRDRMFTLAYKVLHGSSYGSFSNITHFHAVSVKPTWTRKMKHVATIGRHSFYACTKNC